MSTKSSINEVELRKFNKISNQWWKKNGEFKILHQINPIRISYILDKIKYHFTDNDNNLEILDVGCGGGLVTSGLSQHTQNLNNFTITGIDAIQNNIDIATEYAKQQNLIINYYKSTTEELIESSNKKYDVVLCLEVIEHVDNIEYFIENLSNLVKSNGIIIISTINRTSKAYILAIIMAEYILKWVRKGTHDYNKFLKPSEISSIFNKNNIELKELKGLSYNLINNDWQLSEDIEINYFAYLTPINKE
ncbi:MAG: bifunctional 2-polyprenyl-6-hydroxyphenol methylase/3-demethylubiquinol 3-O-methyltransferase UbiG [Rickettsia endosymbiont of Bryobia graminum]|nr:bifunctional 2-polyprenyl-6-hydroxyphenol methylase/3-demethylubiquinol 3-O-methyltransferase UbiG [Rickettsia endosymbiont of Bryobia graminum]